MKYFEVYFRFSHCQELSDAADLLAALAGEVGFETFEETDEGVKGYIQQQLFDSTLLDAVLHPFPMPAVTVDYIVAEAEDRDWNEQWEQEGFEPIVVDDRLVIHDGRHTADLQTLGGRLQVEIDARLAFGTGTHETTRMVCATLLDLIDHHPTPSSLRALDCGCGTGILGIVAMKRGARECVAYDIDEWSVDNTRHNAVINQVELTALLGDAYILNKVEGLFDIILANINRNILLQDMPLMCAKLAPGGRLILSGFYTGDIPMLSEKAQELGLHIESQKQDNDWACITIAKN